MLFPIVAHCHQHLQFLARGAVDVGGKKEDVAVSGSGMSRYSMERVKLCFGQVRRNFEGLMERIIDLVFTKSLSDRCLINHGHWTARPPITAGARHSKAPRLYTVKLDEIRRLEGFYLLSGCKGGCRSGADQKKMRKIPSLQTMKKRSLYTREM